jgi:hypothetical protein
MMDTRAESRMRQRLDDSGMDCERVEWFVGMARSAAGGGPLSVASVIVVAIEAAMLLGYAATALSLIEAGAVLTAEISEKESE